MLRELLGGRKPSEFQMNPFVKTYIISESFLWAAWNFMSPIFAIFIVQYIPGARIETAATAYSAHLVARVLMELWAGKYLGGSSEIKKVQLTIFGIGIISFSYIGLIFTTSLPTLFLFYSMSGLGMGIAAPAKNTLFAKHLDRSKETFEWGFMDAMTFIAIALASALGGFIAQGYGFRTLFGIAGIVSFLSLYPYFLYLWKRD